MPTPPMTAEQMQEAINLLNEHGTCKAASEATGINYKTLNSRINKARENGFHLAEGMRESMDAAKLDGMTIDGGWIITDKDGAIIKRSTRYSQKDNSEDEAEQIEAATESALGRIATATPAAPMLIRSKPADGALFGLLPLFDAHLGLSMPGYGLDEAVSRLVGGAFEAIDAMPAAGCIAIINGGDMTHQNDDSNQTPQSRHPLPISANYTDTTDAATDARIAIIEHAARKFDRVETKDLIGNHDPATAKIIRAALRQRYRDNGRISVDLEGINFWHRTFGKTLLSVHHGDIKRALKDLALSLCQKYRVERGQTTFHEHHTGHLHHVKETRFDLGGVHFCQHAAISRKSNYDEANVYEGDSIIQGITYRESGGRKSTIEVHLN